MNYEAACLVLLFAILFREILLWRQERKRRRWVEDLCDAVDGTVDAGVRLGPQPKPEMYLALRAEWIAANDRLIEVMRRMP